jgi:hypothetical protein
MTLEPKTHRIYLWAATAAPAAEGKAETKTAPAEKGKGAGRRRMVPGSFVVLVVGD